MDRGFARISSVSFSGCSFISQILCVFFFSSTRNSSFPGFVASEKKKTFRDRTPPNIKNKNRALFEFRNSGRKRSLRLQRHVNNPMEIVTYLGDSNDQEKNSLSGVASAGWPRSLSSETVWPENDITTIGLERLGQRICCLTGLPILALLGRPEDKSATKEERFQERQLRDSGGGGGILLGGP